MRVGIHQESVLWPFIFAMVVVVVTEVVANEGRALMYADDLVLICKTKEEARRIFVAWRNALESKGLKVNRSMTKVMKYAWDVAPKETAVDSCSVYVKRVDVNSIHCTMCGYWVHGQCLGVQGSLARVAQDFVCKVCRDGGRQAADEFHLKMLS